MATIQGLHEQGKSRSHVTFLVTATLCVMAGFFSAATLCGYWMSQNCQVTYMSRGTYDTGFWTEPLCMLFTPRTGRDLLADSRSTLFNHPAGSTQIQRSAILSGKRSRGNSA